MVPERVRVRFSLSSDACQRVDSMAEQLGVTGDTRRSEMFRLAVLLFDRWVTAQQNGGRLVLVSGEGHERFLVPFIPAFPREGTNVGSNTALDLTLARKAFDRFNELRVACGFSSNADVARYAFCAFEYAFVSTRRGERLVHVDARGARTELNAFSS